MPNYKQIARQAAQRHGFDPDVFVAQIQQESGFRPGARSGAGATGIAQIMPGTARGWGVDPNDPVASLNAAAKAMAKYTRSYKGDTRKALAAYNAGTGNVAKYGGVPPFRETQDYVKRILANAGSAAQQQPAAPAGTPASTVSSSTSSYDPGGIDPKKAMAINMIFKDSPILQSAMAKKFYKEPTVNVDTTNVTVPGVNSGGKSGGVPGGKQGGLVGAAAAEIGTTAAQAMKYIKAAGGTGNEPWCGDFVQYIFKQKGLAPPPARSVPTLLNWAKKNNRMTDTPNPGDLAMFDWQGDGTPDHVGFVAGRGPGGVNTIEGNTGGPGGRGVYRKTRDPKTILGYVRS